VGLFLQPRSRYGAQELVGWGHTSVGTCGNGDAFDEFQSSCSSPISISSTSYSSTEPPRHRFCNATQDYVALYVNHILHRDWFCAIAIASGTVRLRDLRSCCMVLSHVMGGGRPRGLLQSSVRRVDRILLASVLSSIRAMCPKRVRRRNWTIAVS